MEDSRFDLLLLFCNLTGPQWHANEKTIYPAILLTKSVEHAFILHSTQIIKCKNTNCQLTQMMQHNGRENHGGKLCLKAKNSSLLVACPGLCCILLFRIKQYLLGHFVSTPNFTCLHILCMTDTKPPQTTGTTLITLVREALKMFIWKIKALVFSTLKPGVSLTPT